MILPPLMIVTGWGDNPKEYFNLSNSYGDLAQHLSMLTSLRRDGSRPFGLSSCSAAAALRSSARSVMRACKPHPLKTESRVGVDRAEPGIRIICDVKNKSSAGPAQ
jgi:hypothetical protein